MITSILFDRTGIVCFFAIILKIKYFTIIVKKYLTNVNFCVILDHERKGDPK